MFRHCHALLCIPYFLMIKFIYVFMITSKLARFLRLANIYSKFFWYIDKNRRGFITKTFSFILDGNGAKSLHHFNSFLLALSVTTIPQKGRKKIAHFLTQNSNFCWQNRNYLYLYGIKTYLKWIITYLIERLLNRER